MTEEQAKALKRYEIDETDDQYHVHTPTYVNIYKRDLVIHENNVTVTFRNPQATVTLFKKVKLIHVTVMPNLKDSDDGK